MLITHDGGRTFVRRAVVSRFRDLAAVADSRLAWITTGNGVLRTTDRGRTWQRVSRRVLSNPSFATATAGWAIRGDSYDRRLVATTDGGRTWRVVETTCDQWGWPQLASLVTATRGWIVCVSQPGVGQQPKVVYETTDGGRHWWVRASADPLGQIPRRGKGLYSSGYPSALAFRPSGHGWLSSHRGSLQATTDGGRTWKDLPVSEPDLVEAFALSRVSDRVGFALFRHHPDTLRSTHDGGATWRVLRVWRYR